MQRHLRSMRRLSREFNPPEEPEDHATIDGEQTRFVDHFPRTALLFAVQVHETVDQQSLADLTRILDWSTVVIYQLNASGQNHGLLRCTRGWQPWARAPTSHAA